MQAFFLGGVRRQLTWRGGGPEQVEQFLKITTQRLFLGPELLPWWQLLPQPPLLVVFPLLPLPLLANMGLWDSFWMEAGKPCSGSCALQKQGPKKSKARFTPSSLPL